MKRNLLKIIGIFLTLSLTFTFVSCKKTIAKSKSNCESGWYITPYELDESKESDEKLYSHAAYLSLTRNSKSVKEIWINVKSTEYESVDVTFLFYGSTETYSSNPKVTYSLTSSDVKNSDEGWIKVKEDLDIDYSTLKIFSTGGFDLREVIIIGDDNKVMAVTFTKANILYKDSNGKITGVSGITESEIEKLDLGEYSPLNIIDEQDKFESRNK